MKLIKLLLILIIFSLGVLIGNIYLPQKDTSMSRVISMPALETYGIDINANTYENAQKTVLALEQNLENKNLTLPQRKLMLKELETTLKLQNFKIRENRYQAEIAQNIEGTRTTAELARAAQNYNIVKTDLENYLAAAAAAKTAQNNPPADTQPQEAAN